MKLIAKFIFLKPHPRLKEASLALARHEQALILLETEQSRTDYPN